MNRRVVNSFDRSVSDQSANRRSSATIVCGMAILLALSALITPSWSQPSPPVGKFVDSTSTVSDEVKADPSVTLLVRATGEFVVDSRAQTKEVLQSILSQIKQNGRSLAIRAEEGVAKDKLCSLLADCRRLGVEPIEFAEPDGTPIYHYAGTVVDPTEQPTAGARILLSYYRIFPRAADAPPEAVTDEMGRFEFIRRTAEFHTAEGEYWKTSTNIVAIKEGLGFALGGASYCLTTNRPPDTEQRREAIRTLYRGTPNVLRLVPDDQPIHGRVLDTEGNPVVHAKVEGVNTSFKINGTLDAWEAACAEPNANYYAVSQHARRVLNENYNGGFQSAVVPVVLTDNRGWFTLRGVGRERIEEIIINGSGNESVIINARTCSGPTIHLSMSTRGEPDRREQIIYPREFTVVLARSQTVVGRVTDRTTGKPLAGIVIRGYQLAGQQMMGWSNAGHVRTVTDQEGRYRLTGLPIGRNSFVVLPQQGSSYLPFTITVETTPDAADQVRDIAMVPGVILKVAAVDSTTGNPVRGRIEYIPDPNGSIVAAEPGLQRLSSRSSPEVYYSDSRGRYALPVLPGAGVLAFSALEHAKYPRYPDAEGLDSQILKEIDELVGYTRQIGFPRFARDFHFVALLNVAPDAIEVAQTITLQSGIELAGRVISADGKPVTSYYLYGDVVPGGWRQWSQQQFKVQGYFPKTGRRIAVWDPATNQVGTLDLKGDVTEPVEITLRPGGKLVGRLIDEQGEPIERAALSNASLQMSALDPPHSVGSTHGELIVFIDNRPVLTDSDGRFELSGIIPGLKYPILVGVPMTIRDRKSQMMYPLLDDVTVQPGETKELGDLKPRKSRPPTLPTTTPKETEHSKNTKPKP